MLWHPSPGVCDYAIWHSMLTTCAGQTSPTSPHQMPALLLIVALTCQLLLRIAAQKLTQLRS